MTTPASLADSIPAQYDHAAAQAKWYPTWESRNYFHGEPDAKRRPYAIVIPPPNVTGALHLGHALNNTLQDVLIRFRRMQGWNVLWIPGTDHAGIATQAVVERRLLEEEKRTRHDLGRDKLVERIWNWKDAYETRILGQLKQLGCSCDWQRTRFTLDDICGRAVRETFFRLFRDALVYRGKRLVNWDTFLQTAVSDDEVFHETVAGHFWHFRYPIIDPAAGEPTHVTIATTRPETMLGDTAVAVHPDPTAAWDRAEQLLRERIDSAPARDRGALESELLQLQQRKAFLLPQLEMLRRMAAAGRSIRLPLLDRTIPLIADEWAKPDLGTGCVKITPAHDPNDYEVGLRQRLPMINILNPNGTLNENAGPYRGQPIAEARAAVVADMERLGLLEKIEEREIDLAHSDRSKTPIEPYLADQWFVQMDRLAQSAIDAVTAGRVAIHPSRYAKGYVDWLSEKRDWPVGRQLWWGHRIPVWSLQLPHDTAERDRLKLPHLVKLDTRQSRQAVLPELEGILAAQLVEQPGDGRWILFTCVAPGHEAWEKRLEQAGMVQEADVLDTWFSSALWPHSTLGWPEKTPELDCFYPTSVLVTSRDIITLWVARMVLTGLYNMGDVPFREVFIHPKILDGDGETMSKTKGNGVDPLDVIEKFGADALRFALVHLTTETQDVRMPVDFECPHCRGLVKQTRENRVLPRLQCSHCHRPFGTQWSEKAEDKALPRATVVSERFELARNFCNKLWNASRFTLLNLEGFRAAPVPDESLVLEDRWILSRLSTVTGEMTEALEKFHFADAARALYDFAWDEFCSFYLEMVKPRLQDPARRAVAQQVLAHALDWLMRLLQPITPFLAEEVWQRLAEIAPDRGLRRTLPASESVMTAAWPSAETYAADPSTEEAFRRFQQVLGGVREIRSRQNIPPRTPIRFAVRCDQATAGMLRPFTDYFRSMAAAEPEKTGPNAPAPRTHAKVTFAALEIFVDLEGLIDKAAELQRMAKEEEKLAKLIAGKKSKLEDERFVQRAPAEVVEKERAGLAELEARFTSVAEALASLKKG